MIPLYILGMLLRFGPQHGYQIKKMLMEQMADFTDIKLPTIYYHLEKMEASGLIVAENVKEGLRPEKRVYDVSSSGQEKFQQLLLQTLEIQYRPTFEADAALFFSDYVKEESFVNALERHAANLKKSLARIEEHRGQVVPHLPKHMKTAANLIFEHHELHFQAELTWAEHSIRDMKEAMKEYDKTKNR